MPCSHARQTAAAFLRLSLPPTPATVHLFTCTHRMRGAFACIMQGLACWQLIEQSPRHPLRHTSSQHAGRFVAGVSFKTKLPFSPHARPTKLEKDSPAMCSGKQPERKKSLYQFAGHAIRRHVLFLPQCGLHARHCPKHANHSLLNTAPSLLATRQNCDEPLQRTSQTDPAKPTKCTIHSIARQQKTPKASSLRGLMPFQRITLNPLLIFGAQETSRNSQMMSDVG